MIDVTAAREWLEAADEDYAEYFPAFEDGDWWQAAYSLVWDALGAVLPAEAGLILVADGEGIADGWVVTLDVPLAREAYPQSIRLASQSLDFRDLVENRMARGVAGALEVLKGMAFVLQSLVRDRDLVSGQARPVSA